MVDPVEDALQEGAGCEEVSLPGRLEGERPGGRGVFRERYSRGPCLQKLPPENWPQGPDLFYLLLLIPHARLFVSLSLALPFSLSLPALFLFLSLSLSLSLAPSLSLSLSSLPRLSL